MRLLIFSLTLLISLTFILTGYFALTGRISFTLYIYLATGSLVLLTFTSGHYIYHYYFKIRKK